MVTILFMAYLLSVVSGVEPETTAVYVLARVLMAVGLHTIMLILLMVKLEGAPVIE